MPDSEWEPLYFTTPIFEWSRGQDVIDFAETHMVFLRGFSKGKPMVFDPWQRWTIRSMFEEDEDCLLRYRQYLLSVPRKNGKTLIASAIVLFHLFYGESGDEIYSAAGDRPQAKITFNAVRDQIRANPLLRAVLVVRRDHIENKITGAIYRALSADASRNQGLAPSLVICDEVHAWGVRGEELYAALTEGSGDREESLVISISTASASEEDIFGRLKARGVDVIEGNSDEKQFGIAMWGATPEDDIFDEDVWIRANPNLQCGRMSISDMRSSLAGGESLGLAAFMRYRLNITVRVDGKVSYITPHAWASAKLEGCQDIELGSDVWVGFDGSLNDDSTCISIISRDGRMEIFRIWEKPKDTPEWIVPRDEVNLALEEVFTLYAVQKLAADASFFRTDIDSLARKHRGKVIIVPQSIQRMKPMTETFAFSLAGGDLKHSGHDRTLASHATSAVLKANGLISKDYGSHSPRKIDALVTLILAQGERHRELSKTRTKAKIQHT